MSEPCPTFQQLLDAYSTAETPADQLGDAVALRPVALRWAAAALAQYAITLARTDQGSIKRAHRILADLTMAHSVVSIEAQRGGRDHVPARLRWDQLMRYTEYHLRSLKKGGPPAP